MTSTVAILAQGDTHGDALAQPSFIPCLVHGRSAHPDQSMALGLTTKEDVAQKIVNTSRFVRVILAQGPC